MLGAVVVCADEFACLSLVVPVGQGLHGYAQLLGGGCDVAVVLGYLFDGLCFKLGIVGFCFLGHGKLLFEWLVYQVLFYGFFSIPHLSYAELGRL